MIDFRELPIKLVRPGNCLMCTGVALEPLDVVWLCEEHKTQLGERVAGYNELAITVFDDKGPREEDVRL